MIRIGGHVAQRIRELRALEKDLRLLRARCLSPHAIDDCGILSGLQSEVSSAVPGSRPHVRGAR